MQTKIARDPEQVLSQHTQRIRIFALGVDRHEDGTVDLELPARALTDDEQRTLHSLYPKLTEKAYELLTEEALLQAIRRY